MFVVDGWHSARGDNLIYASNVSHRLNLPLLSNDRTMNIFFSSSRCGFLPRQSFASIENEFSARSCKTLCPIRSNLLRQLSTDHRVAHNHNRKETHQHCTFATCLDLIGQQAVLWNICIWPTNMSNIIFKYFVFFFFSVCISLLSFFAPQFTVRSLGRRWWSTSNCRDRPAATGHSGILPCQLCHWWWVEKFQ